MTVLKYFISVVLEIPVEEIRSVRLLNTFLRRRYRYQKQGILDVLAEMNDNTKINIELQVKAAKEWDKRELFYLGKMLTEDEKYHKTYLLWDEDAGGFGYVEITDEECRNFGGNQRVRAYEFDTLCEDEI